MGAARHAEAVFNSLAAIHGSEKVPQSYAGF